MTTNPYAYYDDEPLPMNARPLSVSSDGEEEPDMEPRCPLELKGHFIAIFRPAVRTYRINVERDSFECRLPNGEYLQLSREEACKRVSVHGNEIDIVLPWDKSYCFRCYRRCELTLARLKVWLLPPLTDPEEAYNSVAGQLKKYLCGIPMICLVILCLGWLVVSVYLDFHRAMTLPAVSRLAVLVIWSVIPVRFVCIILFSAFLAFRFFSQVHVGLLRNGAILSLFFAVIWYVRLFVPEWRANMVYRGFPFFELYLPCILLGIFFRYRRSEKQLQRDNGLI